MRIALVGPFTGASLAEAFEFALASGGLPHGYSGAPFMADLASALVQRGHQVGAITTNTATQADEREPFRAYSSKGLTAYFSPQRRRSFRPADGRGGRAIDLFAYERQCLLAAVKDFRPDVIHAHWTYEFVWAALDSGYPTLATAHDSPAKVVRHMPDLYRAVRYLMARHVLPRCKHLTAVSPDLAADIQPHAKTRVCVISNPVPISVMGARGNTTLSFRSKSLVMILNGWTRLKNATVALSAFKRARQLDPSLRLTCFGADFEAAGPAHRWAKEKGLDDGVDFRGPVQHAVIIEAMQAAAGLLHPSLVEACSVTIAEAMSLGLPVIAGRKTGGVAWQLDEGHAGWLVDVTDPGQLAQAIGALTTDINSWQRLSAAARARARELFSIDRVMDQYEALYRQAIGSTP